MNYICFEQDSLILFNSQKMNKLLCFQYSPFTIYETDNTRIRSPDINFYALLGLKIIDDVPFLMVAEEAEPCCNIGASTVYEVKKIDWIPVVKREELEAVIEKTQEKIKDMVKLFEEGYHYFSDIYRLNTTYYYNIMNEQNAEQRKFYSQFIFNESLMQSPTSEQSPLPSWCKPIIQGYIEQFSSRLTSTQNITYTIISRRSNKKQGTRYFARGIDDKGHVANFTETEQIVSYGKFMVSHLQVRGSVPAFFQQLGISGLSGQLNISRNQAMTQKAFQLHFSKLHQVYNRILCINLLSIKKPQQQKLTLFFQTLTNLYSPQYIRYQYFDFHQQCKNNQFENSERLIEKIKKVVSSFGVTVFDTKLKKLVSRQAGIVRTNCLDCLDRTNYVQSRIGLYMLERILGNFSTPEVKEEIYRYQLFKNKVENSSEILKKFNSAWADNGDKISLHYTGIGSTHTDITKFGKRTLKGTVNHKMRSLMRFFVQFSDHKKHEAIQTIVTNPLMRSTSQKQEPTVDFVNIALLSFNLDGEGNETDSSRCQFTQDYVQIKRPAGVVIYGYRKRQRSLLNWLKPTKPHEQITSFSQQQVAVVRRLGYEVIKKVLQQNSCMMIFGNELIVQNVTEIKHQNIGGHKGTMTICKFNLYQSSMVFSGVNCVGFQNFVEMLEKSHQEAFQYDKLGQAKSSSILAHNYRTLLGNTSSGNLLSQQHMTKIKSQIETLKKQKDSKSQQRLISEVLDGDELTNSITQNNKYLKNYMQGPAYFAPKQNRILFWNKEQIVTKVLDYNCANDVSCVYGHFSYEIR